MLHEYHVVYSVRYCPQFHVTVVGLGTYYLQIQGHYCIITLNGQITASDYVDIVGNQVNPTVQILFPNNDAIFQDYNLTAHTARSIQSWFQEHEDAFQHLFRPTQSPDLNITEPPW